MFFRAAKWTGMMSLGDIDRMFDDLGKAAPWILLLVFISLTLFHSYWRCSFVFVFFKEPSDHEDDDVLPSSPLLHIDDTEANQSDVAASPVQLQEEHSAEETHKVNAITGSTVKFHFPFTSSLTNHQTLPRKVKTWLLTLDCWHLKCFPLSRVLKDVATMLHPVQGSTWVGNTMYSSCIMSDSKLITTLFVISSWIFFLSDLDSPSQGPVRTSSPIEDGRAVHVGVNNDKQRVMSPILFPCDDNTEEAKLQPVQSPQCIRWVMETKLISHLV